MLPVFRLVMHCLYSKCVCIEQHIQGPDRVDAYMVSALVTTISMPLAPPCTPNPRETCAPRAGEEPTGGRGSPELCVGMIPAALRVSGQPGGPRRLGSDGSHLPSLDGSCGPGPGGGLVGLCGHSGTLPPAGKRPELGALGSGSRACLPPRRPQGSCPHRAAAPGCSLPQCPRSKALRADLDGLPVVHFHHVKIETVNPFPRRDKSAPLRIEVAADIH